MKRSILLLFFMSLILANCNSSKKRDKSEESQDSMGEIAEKMIAEGYKKGTVVYSSVENDCEYTIKVEGNSAYLLDPQNMSDTYKKDKMNVWIKYRGLRIKNRCDKASPIEITDIQKRAN